MAKKILCADGLKRTQKQYKEWLANLQYIFHCETNDLTTEEIKALQDAGLLY